MEATPGIEPGCALLQSAASPLRHVAPSGGSIQPINSLGNRPRLHFAKVLKLEFRCIRGTDVRDPSLAAIPLGSATAIRLRAACCRLADHLIAIEQLCATLAEHETTNQNHSEILVRCWGRTSASGGEAENICSD